MTSPAQCPAPEGDRLEVRALRLDAVLGVSDEERARPQPVEVDLDLYLSYPAGAGDDLSVTADYASAVEAAVAVLAGPPRRLLETIAEDMAAALLADDHVAAVTVVVRKLQPPLAHQLGSAGVRITRRRP